MYQKYIITTLFISIFCTNIFAQKSKQEDVVYLKNGSQIRGEITEQKIGENLKIQLLGGSVFVFAENEIDSIKKEAVFAQVKDRSNFYAKHKGFRNMTEGGLIIGHEFKDDWWGYSSRTDWGLMLHTVNGYQFNRFLYTGIGLGVEKNISYRENFAPIYARVAFDMLKKKATPYIFSDIGYAFNWSKENKDRIDNYNNKGGLYFSTGIGIRVFNSSKVSVTTAISYKRTTTISTFETWQGNAKQTMVYNRVGISAGLSF